MSKPLTRKEQYYANIAGEGVEIPAKPITREEAYLEKIAQGGGVVANPEGTPAGTLETVKIGDVVYEVPQGGGSGTTNYELLNNKPSINGHELTGDKSADDLGLFDGDYTHLSNKPSIPAAQVNSDWNATSGVAEIKNKPAIPSALSQLTDDASHRTVSDTEKNAWNAKSNFSGSYDDLTDKPTIPDAQIQSDWNQTDNTKPDYIKNKPAATSQVQTDWEQSDNTKVDYIKNKPSLGSAASKNVPSTGDAGSGEIVMGNDSRLSDSRPASDVSSWAKASSKPTYSASEVGAIDSTALGAAGGVAQLGNDGKVPSSQLPTLFDGDYDSLVHRPSIGGVTLTGDKSASALGLQAEMQLASMPTASVDYAGKLVQYIGATDSTYTHGYFYECVLNQGVYIWQQTNVQASSGGGGTSDYADLTNKPQINGVTLTGNKSTSDLGIDAAGVGLGNVPNVATDDQTPTFTTAQSRNNLVSGEKLSVMLGKISKFFNDLKTVAFTGSFSDLSNKPENANTFQGTIAEWNQLTTAEKKAYDHASIPDSLDGDVTFPASKVIMTGGENVEDAVDGLTANTFGTAVDLTTYNTSSNKYTFPSDGYIYLYCDTNGSSTYAAIMVYLYGANGNTSIQTYVRSRPEASGNANLSLFVKKGMSVYVTTSGTASKQAKFYPLQ